MSIRKTAAELRLHGTFRRDRHADREAEPEPVGTPTKPADLTGEASELWDTLASELVRLGRAGQADSALLAAACDLFAKYRKASEIAECDVTDRATRGAVVSYFTAFQSALSKLGLTPTERHRLAPPAVEKPDALSQFIRKR